MDDRSLLKYHFSRLLNNINFSMGHPSKLKILENVVMRVPRLLPYNLTLARYR